VAAIVLVVVFLAFLRRSRAAHGKSQIWADDSWIIL
jgi:hypothetical protein